MKNSIAKGWRKRGAGRIKLMNTTQTQVRSTDEALSVFDTLKLALEALEAKDKAITAIKEALMSLQDGAQQSAERVNPQGVSNEQVEPVAWEPIETAPKDGSMVLICLPRQMNLVVRGRFNRIHNFWQTDYEGEGGITRPTYFHEGDLWHPIPPLYTHPPVPNAKLTAQPKEPEQRSVSEHLEPVAWMLNGFPYKEKQVQVGGSCRGQEFPNQTPLYTTPPQRPSRSDIKPLTEQFIMDSTRELSRDFRWPSSIIDVWRLCEAAHGIYAPSERRPTDFKE